ncbi:L,D-transpeptidase family protein [Beduinella massiliensis]|uniref:L,D-transpeptidase family protein n=1 Tax=Beduinella massiliensis TaxID=1852363 RepID=UPI000C81FBBF
MAKRILSLFLALLPALLPLPAVLPLSAVLPLALAEDAAPQLTNVLAEDSVLVPGSSWYIEFDSSVAGTVTATLINLSDGSEHSELGQIPVKEGHGILRWDGRLSETETLSAGPWGIVLRLTDGAGNESAAQMIAFDVEAEGGAPAAAAQDDEADAGDGEAPGDGEAEPADEPEKTTPAPTRTPAPEATKKPVPTARTYWEMNPDDYDLDDPEHQQAIWDIMMQPITVLEKDQREHVYPTYEAGAELRPRTNIAGELHGTSQGVNILSEDQDGYTLIEAYSNDGTAIESQHVIDQAAKLIQGYVKTSLLKSVTPSDKYALLVDKLTQKLYIFEDGKIIGELICSTGFPTKDQPYNETPAGEFIVVSWVGQFESGSGSGLMYCDLAMRINGGTLLHEVPHKLSSDGSTRRYANFEAYLGQKASHGCIRIQRAKNEQGQNMRWLWDNLKKNTKVLIWEDKGRTMPDPELPADDTPLYRNLDGGKMYHAVAECPNVKKRFLPLTGDFTYGDLDTAPFDKLTPCPDCHAPLRKETILENWKKAAEQIGAAIPDDVLGSSDQTADEIEGADAPDE